MQYLPATASWQLMTAGFYDGFATAQRLAAKARLQGRSLC